MPPLIIPRKANPSYATDFARSAGQSQNPILRKGLIGAWAPPLGNTGFALRDATGFRADGVLTGMSENDWIMTSLGYMLAFGGGNDEVRVPHRDDLNMPGDGTVIQVFRKASWNGDDGFAGKHQSSNRNWYIETGSSTNNVQFTRLHATTAEQSVILNNAAYYDGTPTFIAAVTIGTNIHLYVGKLGGQLDFADGGHDESWQTNNNPGPMMIGNYRSDSAKNIVADIGTTLLYNRALPEAEIRMLFADHLAPFRLKPRAVFQPEEEAPSGPIGIIHQIRTAVRQASEI